MNVKVLKWLGIAAVTVFFAPILLLMVGTAMPAKHRDVSNHPKHGGRVGQQCIVLKGLRAHGFYKTGGRRDVTDEVDVTTLPGIGGYEITFTAEIPKGTPFFITGVRQCWTCPFDRIDYRVLIPDVPQLAAYPSFVRADALDADQAQCTNQP